MAGAPAIYVANSGPAARAVGLLRIACITAYEDNCFGIAKGAAYSGLVSFFPVLTTVTALLVQANAEAVSRVLARILFEAAPPGTQELLESYLAVQGKRPGSLLVAATLVSIWAASGAMMSLMEGFQAAYRLPSGRPFLKQRAVAAGLVVCAALPMVVGSTLILFGSRAEGVIIGMLGLLPEGAQLEGWVVLVGRVVRYALAFGSITVAAALLYRIGPNENIRFRSVLPGAVLATLLWFGSTLAFGWYVRNIANYNLLYGSIGAVMALLAWMYVLAVVALVGCEFNVAWGRR